MRGTIVMPGRRAWGKTMANAKVSLSKDGHCMESWRCRGTLARKLTGSGLAISDMPAHRINPGL